MAASVNHPRYFPEVPVCGVWTPFIPDFRRKYTMRIRDTGFAHPPRPPCARPDVGQDLAAVEGGTEEQLLRYSLYVSSP
ncbi:hypothetical protein PsYK624_014360 [Phanerochaete sordida]|uniref:Uncharacterized protein n=1 Tax=Phanerochaete sordida TaxID=48140 RepID=A0A9P3FY52_9APHY|nr:hypothetical protein PsYK624_014360 [Phanerochaete sordida]